MHSGYTEGLDVLSHLKISTFNRGVVNSSFRREAPGCNSLLAPCSRQQNQDVHVAHCSVQGSCRCNK